MKYATFFSGIEAPSVAWEHLGWEPVWFSEIDPFCCELLKHHFPTVPNLGDINKVHEKAQVTSDFRGVRLICGGSPCQSFSLAGLRKGLSDPRGNLALVFLGLIDRIKPEWVIWENVPGVMSSWTAVDAPDENGEWEETNDFVTFLSALDQIGYQCAWRILDAQYFGVPQRRRRVFVVGHRTDWRRAAAVLFDSESLRRNPPAGGRPWATTAALSATGVGVSGADDNQSRRGNIVAQTLDANFGAKSGFNNQHIDNGSLFVMATGQSTAEVPNSVAPALNCNHEQPIIFDSRQSISQGGTADGLAQTLNTDAGRQAIFMPGQGAKAGSIAYSENTSPTLKSSNSGTNLVPALITTNDPSKSHLATGWIRRITPIEAERLQGFPDDWTDVPIKGRKAADTPRYKAIGNSMAVPVMRWIGERIDQVNKIYEKEKQS